METKRIGAQTLRFSRPPRVESFANIGAKLEGQGPLADYFDELSEDSFFGEKTWEKGEARMQKRVLSRALEKATRRPEELDLIFAGDLLNQCIGTSFAAAGVRRAAVAGCTARARRWGRAWRLPP